MAHHTFSGIFYSDVSFLFIQISLENNYYD